MLYAVFDPREGPKIVCQVPEGSVATALSTFPAPKAPAAPPPSAAEAQPGSSGLVRSTSEQGLISTQVLFDFSSILDFVIPKPELCGHVIMKATRTSKILGFPIQSFGPLCIVGLRTNAESGRIVDESKYNKGKAVYNRNSFMFNLCFVFERDAELSGFEPIVRKTGRTLHDMEVCGPLFSYGLVPFDSRPWRPLKGSRLPALGPATDVPDREPDRAAVYGHQLFLRDEHPDP